LVIVWFQLVFGLNFVFGLNW